MTLFINACVRKESRTKQLADRLLSRISPPVTELRLSEVSFPVVDEAFLQKRDRLLAEARYDDPLFDLARQFAEADQILIAAPYWDLSFPAVLKQYIEQINVAGITFCYSQDGIPRGLCRAKKLIYAATAGGLYVPGEYGFGYVKALAENFYGIPDTRLILAGGLDIDGADPEWILQQTMEQIPEALL